jgi:hypothetical protein
MKRNRIVILFASVVLIVVFLFVVYLYDSSKKEVISEFQQHQLVHAQLLATEIESFLRANFRTLDILTASNLPPEHMLKKLPIYIEAYSRRMERDHIKRMSLYDETG